MPQKNNPLAISGFCRDDSRNYQRSEQVIRELESKYDLVKVQGSKQSEFKSPDKDEIEMILGTGKPSKKLMLQEKVREALNQSITMSQFINNLERQNIHVLFNQASTERVSGITYLIPGFKIRGQALGNQFKFGSIIKQITYEQSRDGQAIGQANSRTRAKFGESKQAIPVIRISKTGVPYSKEWYHFAKSRGIRGLPEISFGIIDPSQTRNLRIDERAAGHEKVTKETSTHLDHHLSCDRHSTFSIFGGIAGLLDVQVGNSNKEKEDKKRKRGMSI